MNTTKLRLRARFRLKYAADGQNVKFERREVSWRSVVWSGERLRECVHLLTLRCISLHSCTKSACIAAHRFFSKELKPIVHDACFLASLIVGLDSATNISILKTSIVCHWLFKGRIHRVWVINTDEILLKTDIIIIIIIYPITKYLHDVSIMHARAVHVSYLWCSAGNEYTTLCL